MSRTRSNNPSPRQRQQMDKLRAAGQIDSEGRLILTNPLGLITIVGVSILMGGGENAAQQVRYRAGRGGASEKWAGADSWMLEPIAKVGERWELFLASEAVDWILRTGRTLNLAPESQPIIDATRGIRARLTSDIAYIAAPAGGTTA